MITSEIVEQACSEVSEYTDTRMMDEFERFFREQPALCEFIMELTSESSQQIQELSLFLSYMVFKAAKIGDAELQAVSSERIESAYRESESWIDRLSQAEKDPADVEIAARLRDDSEPYLLQYVISELNQPLEDGTLLEDEQKGEVFFVLKTVISSLARRPFGQET